MTTLSATLRHDTPPHLQRHAAQRPLLRVGHDTKPEIGRLAMVHPDKELLFLTIIDSPGIHALGPILRSAAQDSVRFWYGGLFVYPLADGALCIATDDRLMMVMFDRRAHIAVPRCFQLAEVREWIGDRFLEPDEGATAADVFIGGNVLAIQCRKKRAGRVLNGVVYDGFPAVSEVPFG